MLIGEPVVNLDDSASSSDFDDFEDFGEGFDLGLGEEPGSLLDYLRARCERVARSSMHLFDARGVSSHGAHTARLSPLPAGPEARLLPIEAQ